MTNHEIQKIKDQDFEINTVGYSIIIFIIISIICIIIK